ncbi:MAG: hypothetical protein ISS35_08650 [Kiritimatiellae bacterium]|nr:hypothetical protein [Kiritimatiellia bacterium]
MIYDPQKMLDGNSPLADHIAEQMKAICGDHGVVGEDNLEELANSVASYVNETHGDGAVHAGYLVMLSSQALTAVGEHQAARRMLVVGSGLMRPAKWEVSGEDTMWVLDLREMTVQADCQLEIVFFNCLTAVLDMMGDLWDQVAGRGVLGLRHVSTTAAVLGGGTRGGDISREIREMCQDRLQQIAETNGWMQVPQVLDLDLT